MKLSEKIDRIFKEDEARIKQLVAENERLRYALSLIRDTIEDVQRPDESNIWDDALESIHALLLKENY